MTTTSKRRTHAHRDVAEIEAAIMDTLGGEASAHVRRRIRRACELQALADRCRALALAGEEFDIVELNRLESIAAEAMAALDLPKARHKVEVQLIDQQPLDLSRLTDQQLEELEALLTAAGAREVDVCDRPLQAANDSLRREVERLSAENRRLREDADHYLERISTLSRQAHPAAAGKAAGAPAVVGPQHTSAF